MEKTQNSIKLIQRIQSLYLLVVLVLSIVAGIIVNNPIWIQGLFLATGISAGISIFLFKNRKLQFVLGRVCILLSFVILGTFVYRSLNLSGEMAISKKDIWMAISGVSIVLLVLSNKAIQRDENLVKSVDRLR